MAKALKDWMFDPITSLWISIFLSTSSFVVTTSAVPLFILQLDQSSSATLAGFAVGISFIVSASTSPFWGWLADRYGPKPMVMRSAIGLTLSYGLMCVTTNVWQLIALRVFNGLVAGLVPAANASAALIVPSEHLSRTMAKLTTARSAGSIAGPAIAGVIAIKYGLNSLFILTSAMMAISAVHAYFFVPNIKPASSKMKISLLTSLKNVSQSSTLIQALVVSFAITCFLSMLQPITPIFLAETFGKEHAPSLLNLCLTGGGTLSLLLLLGWGRIEERIGYRWAISISTFFGGLFLICIAFVTSETFFYLNYFSYIAFICGITPLLSVYLVASSPKEMRAQAFGLQFSFSQVGLALGPLIGGVVIDVVGAKNAFIVTGLIFIIVAIVSHHGKLLKKYY